MHGLWIMLERFELQQQRVWDLRAAHRDEALDLADVQDWHDARDDRHLDAHVPRVLDEAVEVRVVEEQLRDDEAAAVVDLALEVLQVARAVQALRVTFGIAGYTDAEAVVARLDELDELVGIREAALGRDEIRLPCLRVAAQREDVADALVPQLVEDA